MSHDYVTVLTPEELAEDREYRAGCLAGLICCGVAMWYYSEVFGPLDSPVKKIGFLGCGLLTMKLGYVIRNFFWGTIYLAIVGFIGWKLVLWIIA